MRAVDVIRRKRDGYELSAEEIRFFVDGATRSALAESDPAIQRTWPDYQLSAWLMAAYLQGLSPAETAALTQAMAYSGEKLDLSDIPGVKVDKHSTGGVGDKTSLILGPLAAACGVVVPMMSGRGLGHTGGTLDKLESIPGFRVQLSEQEFRSALHKARLGLIGQTPRIAPADKKLYALRDVTATVESIPLITASILSKKIAEGISGLVLDVKCGLGAFMTSLDDARALAESLVQVGRANGLNIVALITAMDVPLGRTVGNSLEVIECIETLKGHGPSDLTELSVLLAARMVRLAGLAAQDEQAVVLVRSALDSGQGLEVFRQVIAIQGGDPRVVDDYRLLPQATKSVTVTADRTGYLAGLHAGMIGTAAMMLGAGRERAEDAIDHAVGIICRARLGQTLHPGDVILEVRYREEGRLPAVLAMLKSAVTIADAPTPTSPLVLDELSEGLSHGLGM